MVEIKKCIVCGREFESKRSNHLCCCRRCRDINKNNKTSKKCKCCGNEFRPKNDCQIYCSSKCKKISKKDVFGESKCEYCGKIFVKNNASHKYCCSLCKQRDNKERNYILKSEDVFCGTCGKKIRRVKNSADKSFCSKECKKVYMIDICRDVALQRLSNGLIKTTNTKPQQICDLILEDLNIKYTNEKRFNKYCIDTYIDEFHLCIEVMGDYWHSNCSKFSIDNLNVMQIKNIFRDIRKRDVIQGKYNTKILYLWESELNNDYDLCKSLILFYIKNKGDIENYHSFNYKIINNKLTINKNIIFPFMERDVSTMNDLTRKLHSYEDAKV